MKNPQTKTKGANFPMGALIWIVVITTSVWVLVDAKKIGVKKGQLKGLADLGPWVGLLFAFFFGLSGFRSTSRSEDS
jgi:hypothetical protein